MDNLTPSQRKTLAELAAYTGNLGKVMYSGVDKSLIDAGLVLVREKKNPRNKCPRFYYRLSAKGREVVETPAA